MNSPSSFPDRLTGMVPPIVVPFQENGDIDENALRSEVRFLFSTRIHGISSGGSTGEGAMLDDNDLRKCLEIIGEENCNRLPVYAGIIRNSTREVIRAGLDAKSLGADALLVTPVFYHGATEEENFAFFREISETVKLPTIIYNVVPTNIISPQLFYRMAKLEWILGIKQVDPVRMAEMACAGDYRVFGACDQMLYGIYVSGACGAISAMITVAPELCLRQWDAFLSGNQAEAIRIQKLLTPIVETYLRPPYPPKVKALINLQGRTGGLPRKPALPVCEPLLSEMRHALRNAALISS
jgi:dihydrodipicolinate synthase/N-acetylneuraminate lyase